MDTTEEMELARNLGIREVSMFSRVAVRRRRVVRHRHAGGHGGRDRRRRGRRLLPGVQRAVGQSLRQHERRASASCRCGCRGTAPYGLMTPAAWVGLYARPYMERYGVTNADFGRIAVVDRAHAATNPGCLVLRTADHTGGPPGVAVDHRARAAAARLLPGERRRRRAGRDVERSGRATFDRRPR